MMGRVEHQDWNLLLAVPVLRRISWRPFFLLAGNNINEL